jgi:WD40 repeat protein
VFCECLVLTLSLWAQLFRADDSMEFIHTAATFQFSVRSVDFSPEGNRLAAAGDDPTMSIISVDDQSESNVVATLSVGPNTRGLAWDPAGTYVAVVQTNGSVHVWDASTQQEVWKSSVAPTVRALNCQIAGVQAVVVAPARRPGICAASSDATF